MSIVAFIFNSRTDEVVANISGSSLKMTGKEQSTFWSKHQIHRRIPARQQYRGDEWKATARKSGRSHTGM